MNLDHDTRRAHDVHQTNGGWRCRRCHQWRESFSEFWFFVCEGRKPQVAILPRGCA